MLTSEEVAAIPLFSALPAAELEKLARNAADVRLSAGEFAVHEGEEGAPRRAFAVEIPATRHEHREWTSTPEPERARLSKRNFYRIIDRFGHRRDLASD